MERSIPKEAFNKASPDKIDVELHDLGRFRACTSRILLCAPEYLLVRSQVASSKIRCDSKGRVILRYRFVIYILVNRSGMPPKAILSFFIDSCRTG